MREERILLRGNGDFTVEQYLEVLRGDEGGAQLLSLGLTTAPGCNMRCIYCYNEGGRNEAGRPVEDRMSLKDYEKAIRQAAALGAQSVIMVGVGETMLDKNFATLVEMVDFHGMIPLVFTNGTLLDKKMASFLFRHHASIYLALDSVREETFNIITRTRGELPVVLKGIDACLEAGFGQVYSRNGYQVTDFAVNTMVMRINEPELAEIEEFCRRRNILFTCRFPEKLGTAKELWEIFVAIDGEEERRLREKARQHSLGNEVFRTDLGCLFWVVGVLLGIDGRTRLCYSLNQRQDLGNIKKDDLIDIIRKKRLFYPHHENQFCPIHLEQAVGT